MRQITVSGDELLVKLKDELAILRTVLPPDVKLQWYVDNSFKWEFFSHAEVIENSFDIPEGVTPNSMFGIPFVGGWDFQGVAVLHAVDDFMTPLLRVLIAPDLSRTTRMIGV